MSNVAVTTTFVSGTTILASAVNGDFSDITTWLNNRNTATTSWDGGSFAAAITITPTTNQIVLGTTRTVTVNAGTPASSSRVWTIPDISADGTFASLEGTQTFSGTKTFTSSSGIILSQTGGIKLLTTFLDSSGSQATYSGFNTAATTNVFELAINRNPVSGTHIQTGQAASSIKLNSASADASITFSTSSTNNASPTIALVIDKSQNTQHADGLVGTPSVTFQNDTDCGMWRVGANDIAWSTNGVKAIELTTADFLTQAVALDMVGNIIKRVGRGSVTAPGFYFNNDTGTGLYWPTTDEFALTNAGVKSFRTTSANSVVLGKGAALATTATDGFVYIPTCAGAPTGVPTAQAGTVAMIFDTSNNRLYIYNAAWKGGTTPGAWS